MDELKDVEGMRASGTGTMPVADAPVADAPQRRETTREAPRVEPRIGKIEAGEVNCLPAARAPRGATASR